MEETFNHPHHTGLLMQALWHVQSNFQQILLVHGHISPSSSLFFRVFPLLPLLVSGQSLLFKDFPHTSHHLMHPIFILEENEHAGCPNLFAEGVLQASWCFIIHNTTITVYYLDMLKDCIQVLHFTLLRWMQTFTDKYLQTLFCIYIKLLVIYFFNNIT